MSNKFTVTLKALRKSESCFEGYNRLVRHLQGKPFTADDEAREAYVKFRFDSEIPIKTILESNGLDDALWAFRCVSDSDRDLRLYAVWCARQVQHLMKDRRSLDALDVAERFASGESSESELNAAGAAAGDAAWAAARDAARAAARAAAWAAAWNAAGDAARDAAGAAARAAAGAAARAAAGDAAWAAARDAQEKRLIEMLDKGEF